MPATEAATGCTGILFLIFILMLPGIGVTVFWIYMIAYCIKHQEKDRTAWIIVNFLCGPLGSLIYLFFKDPKKIIH